MNSLSEIQKLCSAQHEEIVNQDIKIIEDTLFHLRKYKIHFGICSNVYDDISGLIEKIEKNLSVCKKYVRSIDD